jgi:ubiquinol-cytochrome c reductase cytochrome c subunit
VLLRALASLAALLAFAPAAAAAEGGRLYSESCIACHGPDGRGVAVTQARRGPGDSRVGGPPLRGVGAAAVDLYLSTGLMPLDDAFEQPRRSEPAFTREEIDALVDFVTGFDSGGPPIAEPHPERGDVATGMELYTDYCAGCHQMLGEGGVVVGAVAPELHGATPVQIAEAVRVGPYVMPAFDEETISDAEVDDLIAYVLYTRRPSDEGGWALGHLGPVPEGLVAWFVGAAALVLVAVLIGERARP